MKILYLGDAGSPHLYRITDYFKNNGHTTLTLTLHPPAPDFSGRVMKMKTKGPRSLSYLTSLNEVIACIKDFQPDLLHAHFLTSYAVTAAFTGFSPMLVQCWGSDLLKYSNSTYFKIFQNKVFERASAFMVPSLEMKDILCNKYGFQGEILVNPLGIDEKIFFPKKKEVIEQLIDKPVFISCRNLEPLYRVNMIIRAFKIAKKQLRGANLIVAGKGKAEKELKEMAKSEGLAGDIEFTGQIDPSELAERLRRATAAISVPEHDAIGQVNLEAMACGTALIVNALPGPLEWVKDGEQGIVLKETGIDDLSRAMTGIALNRELLENALKTGPKIIEKKGYFKENMKDLEALYARLVEKK